LGYPDESPITEGANGGAIRYYIDGNNVLHVPKRPLAAVAHVNTFASPLAAR
jgi:hypothetical protein